MKVLVVGPLHCPHLSSWTRAATRAGVEIIFYCWWPSTKARTFFGPERLHKRGFTSKGVRYFNLDASARLTNSVADLGRIIRTEAPILIHAVRVLGPGELARAALGRIRRTSRPPLITSSQGSDLNLEMFSNSQVVRIKKVLEVTTYLWSECHRDFKRAKDLGYRGAFLNPIPQAGGIPDATLNRARLRPSLRRNVILIKGYENSYGRALTCLSALADIRHALRGFRVQIYSPSPQLRLASERFRDVTGLPVSLLPPARQDRHVRRHAKAFLSLGCSLTDGISISVLEAMAMGSIPVQSNSACCSPWIKNGVNGFLFDPRNAETLKKALLKALELGRNVPEVRQKNMALISKTYSHRKQARSILEGYQRAAIDALE